MFVSPVYPTGILASQARLRRNLFASTYSCGGTLLMWSARSAVIWSIVRTALRKSSAPERRGRREPRTPFPRRPSVGRNRPPSAAPASESGPSPASSSRLLSGFGLPACALRAKSSVIAPLPLDLGVALLPVDLAHLIIGLRPCLIVLDLPASGLAEIHRGRRGRQIVLVPWRGSLRPALGESFDGRGRTRPPSIASRSRRIRNRWRNIRWHAASARRGRLGSSEHACGRRRGQYQIADGFHGFAPFLSVTLFPHARIKRIGIADGHPPAGKNVQGGRSTLRRHCHNAAS